MRQTGFSPVPGRAFAVVSIIFGLALWLGAASCRGAENAPAPTIKLTASDIAWRDARDAETRGDYPAMVKILLPLANSGDVAAQYTVGLMYDTGQSGRKDHQEAAKWYGKAAEQGFARAQYYLGYIYYHDEGDLKDDAKALKWYRRAADQGTAMAQHSLGIMYAKGEGTSQDYAQAYKWFSLAATRFPSTGGGAYQRMADKARDAAAAKLTPMQIAAVDASIRDWKPVLESVPGKNPNIE